jgi:lipopolysaccharide biosynthesis glycosyltransferase
MEKRPLISVLIPTYNCARFIQEAIDSILAQEYDNLEIIVVDDGSTDDTPNVVERIVGALRATPLRNRNPIKYFYQPNAGISAARNACLEHASGEYIAWLDADDYWLPGKLQAQVEYFEEHLDCEIVFTRYANFLENEKLRERCDVQHEIKLENKIFTHFTSALIKRKVFERIGNFNENLTKGEDSEWIFRLSIDSAKSELYIDSILPKLQYSNKGLFPCIEGIYYFRRLHGDNITLADNNSNFFLSIVSTNLRKKIKRLTPNISVFIAADNNYACLLVVALYSILRNTKSHIDFYILDGGISAENKVKIETLKSDFSHFSLEFIAIDVDAHFRDFKTTEGITLSMYSRLLIPQLKPEIGKAIYLDADIIAMGDVAELLNESLDDYHLGAVWATSVDDVQHNRRLGISNNHKYFNSGVLLINCKKWRENYIVEELFLLESKVRNKLIIPDQDLLNIYFDGKVKILPSKYNTTTRIVLLDRILKNNTDKIVIRHFESTEKPHNSHYYGIYQMPHFEEFWYYAGFTPFLEMLPKNHQIQAKPDLSKLRQKTRQQANEFN